MREEPHNAEAEVWFLGGILNDPRAMAQFAHALAPKDFYLEKHRLVWEAFQMLFKDGIDIDPVSVGSLLRRHNCFQSLFGSNDYIFSLLESVSSAANVEHFADLISKASALRKLISAMNRTISEAYDPAADADSAVSSALERISSIASYSSHSSNEHIADIAREVLDGIKGRMEAGTPAGCQTGFCEFDGLTGGLRSGELVIVGARTGMGKTSFAIDIAIEAAKTMPVKFFSLEMEKKQIVPRALSFFSQVNLKKTINAKLNESELLNQYAVIDELLKLNLYMEFESGLSIGEICTSSHSFVANHGPGLIVIDHLHYIKTGGESKYENRNLELGKITHSLKELAKKLESPIMLLSQLNRDIDRAGSKDKMPRLSDLRDSGHIEQDADMVWFIHRPGYYDASIAPSETVIKIAKNRSGPTGEAKLHFDTNTTRFSDPVLKDSPVNWSNY
jgi:replicative DNA helicase